MKQKFKHYMETSLGTKKRNDGYSTKRLREILGVKQEDLADKLGLSQQAISKLEQKEVIEDDVLEKIAIALNIPIDTIRNYSDDATLNIIVNSLHDNSSIIQNYYPTFNTVDKLVELYERLLETEKQKVTLLEEVLKSKK